MTLYLQITMSILQIRTYVKDLEEVDLLAI